MSIERSASTGMPNPTGKNGVAARSQAAPDQATAEAGAASFLSVLTALEPQAALELDTRGAALADAASALQATDAAILLAQNASGAANVAPVEGASEAAALSAVAGKAAFGKGRPTLGAGNADAGLTSQLAQALELQQADGSSVAVALSTQKSSRNGDGGRQNLAAGGVAPTSSAALRADEARASAELVGADWRVATTAHLGDLAAAGPALPDSGAALKASSGNRGSDRPVMQPVSAASGSTLAGAWAEQAMPGGGVAAGPAFTLEGAPAMAPAALADKLSYWVFRGVQNAGIQLDAFGGGSVDVRISVHGNEAQVEFRTDQPEARRLLQDAMPQLKEMLKSEGLFLAGGFVGTSAQSDPGAQERRNQSPGARARLVGSAPLGPAVAAAPRCGTTGRSVDLFV